MDSKVSPATIFPPEIILVILEHAFATAKPNTPDLQLCSSLLLINRQTYAKFVEKLYSTVVLWSEEALDKFCCTLESSQHLGPLVLHLWAGNESIKILDVAVQQNSIQGAQASNDQESRDSHIHGMDQPGVITTLQRILAKTTHLQRLHIDIDITSYTGRPPRMFPSSLKHLTVSSLWISKTVGYDMKHSNILAGLETLRVRGVLWTDDAIIIPRCNPDPLLLVVEAYSMDHFGGIGAFMNIMLTLFDLRQKQHSLKVVAPSYLCHLLRKAIAHRGDTYGNVPEGQMARMTISPEDLDRASQLSAWLALG